MAKLIIEKELIKQGSSNYILIPKAITDALGKKTGDKITVEIKK